LYHDRISIIFEIIIIEYFNFSLDTSFMTDLISNSSYGTDPFVLIKRTS